MLLPLEVHRGDVEDHSLEPQDHEEPLGEGAVADALSITARLGTTQTDRAGKPKGTASAVGNMPRDSGGRTNDGHSNVARKGRDGVESSRAEQGASGTRRSAQGLGLFFSQNKSDKMWFES